MFSKLMKKTLAVAALAAMTSVMAGTESPWWSIDFDDYAEGKLTATTEIQGSWNQTADDESVVANQQLELNTQGKDLTWTPKAVADSYDYVILDADVKFVASDVEPETDAEMQTAIYLKATDTGTTLCAWSKENDTAKWIELDNFTIADGTEAHVKMTIDYNDESGAPVVNLDIDGTTATFPVAAVKEEVTSVSFRGTGIIDNFAAQTGLDIIYVASVGGQQFDTYAAAFAYAAANGGALTITGESAVAGELKFGELVFTKDTTIDLAGKTIEAAFVVDGGAQFSVANGTVNAPTGYDTIYIKNGKATVAANTTINASDNCAVFIKNTTDATAQLALDVYGTLASANSPYATIQGNGLNVVASEINIFDGASVTHATEMAIYHPQDGALTIGAATVTGTTGIEMRAGTLVVNGATITATGTFSAEANNDGSTVEGAAIALSQHTTAQPTTVTVNSGTLNGQYAFYQCNVASGSSDSVAATIAAGTTLNGTVATAEDGFVMPQAADGSYTLEAANFVVAGQAYDTIDAAIAAAEAGQTVEVYTDFDASEIITINKDITLDGNGYTLTSTAPRAINVDGAVTVTIQDLTINASGERAINVINGAANVTIDNVTATAAMYTVNVAASAAGAKVSIVDSNLTGCNAVNVAAANAVVTVNNTTANFNELPEDGCIYGAYNLNPDATNGSIAVTGGTINLAGDRTVAANNAAVGGTVTIDGSTDGVDISVALIGYAGFTTLEEAVEACKAGQTIKLIRDVNESVTVANDATIDLNGYSINGAFVVDNGATLSVDNGTVTAPAGSDTIYIKNGKAIVGADATINASDNCAVFIKNTTDANATLALDVYGTLYTADSQYATIQGNGLNVVASEINIFDGASVTHDTEMAIYHPQAGDITIGEATVTGTTGIEMRAGTLVVDGATITATGAFSAEANNDGSTVNGAAIALSQHTTAQPTTVTVNSGTLNGQFAFYQCNVASGTSESVAATIAAGTTIDGAVATAEDGFVMPQAADGSYTLAAANFVVAGQAYDTIDAAIAAAEAGQTVEVYTDFDASEIITINKDITIDGNGYTLTSTAPRAINVSGAVTVTIQDLTINASGERAINVIQGAANVTIKNVTATAANYAVNVAASAADAVVTIDGSTLTGKNTVNVTAVNADVTVADSTVNCIDDSAANKFAALAINKDATGATINASTATINVTTLAGEPSYAALCDAEGGEIIVNGYDVVYSVAIIEYGTMYNSFTSLADAIEYAAAGDTVKLIRDVEASEPVVIDKAITLDGNGYTLTSTAPRAINVSGADGATIQNLTIEASGERAINVIQGATNVAIKNVTATAANYAVNVAASAADAVVTIDGSTLTGKNTVNVGAVNADVTVADSTVNCIDDSAANKFAALAINKDATDATITAPTATINVTTLAGEPSYAALCDAEGGEIIVNGYDVVYSVAVIEYGTMYNGFTSLADAIEYAKASDTVKLIRAVAEDVEIAKVVTLDLNGYAMTGTATITDTAAALVAPEGLSVTTSIDRYVVEYDTDRYVVEEVVIEFAPVAVAGIAINGDTAVLTLDGEYTEVKVYFCETLGAEWEEVSGTFADGTVTVPATTATGFFKVEAR